MGEVAEQFSGIQLQGMDTWADLGISKPGTTDLGDT